MKDRALECARVAADNRGRDVMVLELKGIVDWVDYLIVATGSSRRQLANMADEIEAAMKEMGDAKIGIEGYEAGSWVVLDFADIVVHLFNDEKRGYYQIEHLWADAPVVEWRQPVVTETATDVNLDQPHAP